jgi:hypothetical protein
MITKRIILLFIILCYNQLSFANFWSNLKDCVKDPCNCGVTPEKRYENWDGQRLDKGKRNKNCPPYNKEPGRNDNTCLVKDDFPGKLINYYENLCGEEVPQSGYFQPQIRLRGQQCNAAACWTTSNILNWDGECVTLAGGYGFPLHRMCSRIALPLDDVKDIPADPGYTQGQHLNFEGATKTDDPIYDNTGNLLTFDPPKLCLYKDPSFFSISGGYDVMDLDPFKQPYHETTNVHPIIQVLQFLIKIRTVIATAPFELFKALFDLIDNEEDGSTTFGATMAKAMEFIIKIYELIGDTMLSFLDEVGQMNRVVDSKIYGCVNIPFGPYPPPFCETVLPFSQIATTQKICPKDSSGNIIDSTQNQPCVTSNLTNNFVRNTVRVGFETLVPLCTHGEDPMLTDACVTIENLGIFSSASAAHAATSYRDLIQHCDKATPGQPCIKTTLPHNCTVTSNGCNDGFRIVYGTKLGSTFTPQSYYYSDLTDCTGSEAMCQQIWGVNLGEFVDTTLQFSQVQDQSNISPLSKTFSLTDKNDQTVTFTTSIVKMSSFNNTYSFTQEPNQICVFDGISVIGCENRIPPSDIKMYDCSSGFAGISCSSSYFVPKFIAAYNENGDIVASLVEPLTVYNSGTSNLNTNIILAGDNFESFVTDDSFITRPFSGSHSPNPSSIFGTYQDDKPPVDGNNTNDNAVYLVGLEYINDEYHVGGKFACLEQPNTGKCPDNVQACVLTKLLESNIVACSDFIAKSSSYANFGVCPSDISSCTAVDSLTKLDGGSIDIYDCGTSGTCYDNSGVELCKISYSPDDREDPSPSLGNTLADDEYYNPGGTVPGNYTVSYDTDKYAIRSKTAIERGLCIAIPLGTCAEQNDYSEENGYAYWPETNIGEIATGTCKSGLQASADLKRYCIPDSETQTFKFEPLYRTDSKGNKTYTDIKCIPPIVEIP